MFIGVIFTNDVHAQRRARSVDTTGIMSKLWYGGNAGIGLGTGYFYVSLAPMVGYKITDKFSVGPRVQMAYINRRVYRLNADRFRNQTFDFGLAAFARYKVFRAIFAHAEYGHLWYQNYVSSLDKNQWQNDDEALIGLGYLQGSGKFGYEILGLYRLTRNGLNQNPFDIRVGFTYNF